MRVLLALLACAAVARADTSVGGEPAKRLCPRLTSRPADPERIARLLRTLDDDADPLHADFTPSVFGLIQLGLPGAAAVVDTLESPSGSSRMHASRVIEGVLGRCYGFAFGQGFPNRRAEDDWRRVWRANGSYDDQQPPEKSRAAVAKWRAWIKAALDEESRDRR
jgi:hypothetical protein